MQIQAAESGDGWVLYIKERKVGYIRGDHLRFIGFASEDEAAQAACIAHCALAMVRAKATPSAPEEYLFGHTEEGQFVIALSGVVARLLRPESRYAEDGWGFEVALRPDETFSVFAMARARRVWKALRASGAGKGMSPSAAVDSTTWGHRISRGGRGELGSAATPSHQPAQ